VRSLDDLWRSLEALGFWLQLPVVRLRLNLANAGAFISQAQHEFTSEARSLMVHHICTRCCRSAELRDGGHTMLFAATVRGRPLFNRRSEDQETRRVLFVNS
jgi:hypothetical protein